MDAHVDDAKNRENREAHVRDLAPCIHRLHVVGFMGLSRGQQTARLASITLAQAKHTADA